MRENYQDLWETWSLLKDRIQKNKLTSNDQTQKNIFGFSLILLVIFHVIALALHTAFDDITWLTSLGEDVWGLFLLMGFFLLGYASIKIKEHKQRIARDEILPMMIPVLQKLHDREYGQPVDEQLALILLATSLGHGHGFARIVDGVIYLDTVGYFFKGIRQFETNIGGESYTKRMIASDMNSFGMDFETKNFKLKEDDWHRFQEDIKNE